MKKKCFKCGEIKLLCDFYKHSKMKDGHVNKCKICNKKDVADHRLENIDRIRTYDRKRGVRQSKEYFRNWRKSNPKKYKAHSIVGYHVRAGNIRKKPCEICGNKKVVAHHDNYNFPLDVRWLCQAHHKQWHVKNKPIN